MKINSIGPMPKKLSMIVYFGKCMQVWSPHIIVICAIIQFF